MLLNLGSFSVADAGVLFSVHRFNNRIHCYKAAIVVREVPDAGTTVTVNILQNDTVKFSIPVTDADAVGTRKISSQKKIWFDFNDEVKIRIDNPDGSAHGRFDVHLLAFWGRRAG